METNKTGSEAKMQSPVIGKPAASETREGRRRRRWEMTSDNVRYFLPRTGSSPAKPELGQEMGTEGDALVEAFKSGQVFYTVVAWKAVPQMNGSGPVIVKQALPRS